MGLGACRWCGKRVNKFDDKVCLDSRMRFYDHKTCNLERWEARRNRFGDVQRPKEPPTLNDFGSDKLHILMLSNNDKIRMKAYCDEINRFH